MKRHLLLAEFASQLWAIQPSRLAAIASVLARWTQGEAAEVFVRQSVDQDRQGLLTRQGDRPAINGTAHIPIFGIIAQRQVQDVSGPGMSSSNAIGAALKKAVNDPAVQQIVLEIDSPGGSVYGIQETAKQIRDARAQKPVYAIANSLAASAAYWLGSQASQLYVTPSGEVGSIGVYSAHEYIGEALKKQGVDITLLSAGEFKTEGNPFEPLSDQAKAYQLKRINDYYTAFVSDVAQGRSTNPNTVAETMGKGRTFGAYDALAAGMVDDILTLDELADRIRQNTRKPRNRRALAERELALSALI